MLQLLARKVIKSIALLPLFEEENYLQCLRASQAGCIPRLP
jgi:hypothetical protein